MYIVHTYKHFFNGKISADDTKYLVSLYQVNFFVLKCPLVASCTVHDDDMEVIKHMVF